MAWSKKKALIMRSEATGPGVQHEGFDVDEQISLFNFCRVQPLNGDFYTKKVNFYLATCNIMLCSTIRLVNFITLMGSSSFSIDGVSRRVIYSDSLSKMLQHGIEKSNFSDSQFDHLCKPTKLWGALARLILIVFQNELYILNLWTKCYNMA